MAFLLSANGRPEIASDGGGLHPDMWNSVQRWSGTMGIGVGIILGQIYGTKPKMLEFELSLYPA